MYELILAIAVQVAVVAVLFRWAVRKQRRLAEQLGPEGRGAHGRH